VLSHTHIERYQGGKASPLFDMQDMNLPQSIYTIAAIMLFVVAFGQCQYQRGYRNADVKSCQSEARTFQKGGMRSRISIVP